MSSVADSITGALIRFGRKMTLRRTTLGPGGVKVPLDVIVYGTTRNYTVEELVGTVVQGDTEVTFSNAQISIAQWPGPPRNGDVLIIDGVQRAIKGNPEPKYLGAEVLVFVAQVRG